MALRGDPSSLPSFRGELPAHYKYIGADCIVYRKLRPLLILRDAESIVQQLPSLVSRIRIRTYSTQLQIPFYLLPLQHGLMR